MKLESRTETYSNHINTNLYNFKLLILIVLIDFLSFWVELINIFIKFPKLMVGFLVITFEQVMFFQKFFLHNNLRKMGFNSSTILMVGSDRIKNRSFFECDKVILRSLQFFKSATYNFFRIEYWLSFNLVYWSWKSNNGLQSYDLFHQWISWSLKS